jgi:hypothetical protein
MKNRFSPQFSDEDLDLYLGGKVTQNLTASIEEHYFGASATGHPSDGRRREAIVIAAAIASLLPLASLRINQKPEVQTIALAIATPALPFASAIAASIDLFAPAMLPVTAPAVPRPPQAEPPAVAFYSNAIPELPFESEVSPIREPQKRHRLRRFLLGAIAPLRLIIAIDRANRGV